MAVLSNEPKLVLASQSPRRVELLKLLGLQFDTIPSDIDESTELTDPIEVVKFLATAKAQLVASQLAKNGTPQAVLVLGADTIVVLGTKILGKPTSRDDAYRMLESMSGQAHKVYTGVAIADLRTGDVIADYACSDVVFRNVTPDEIAAYVQTDEPLDKAGSYAVQGAASAFIDKIVGCYTNIIGLPTPLTVRMLRGLGLQVLGLPK